MHGTPRRNGPRARGFTLVELLVVIAIIGLISAAALPVVLPALNERRVSEAARILQANLAGVRDAAIRANAPRGLRFLPDPVFSFNANTQQGGPLASNRFVPIEPAPDYGEGIVSVPQLIFPNSVSAANPSGITDPTYLAPSLTPTFLRVAEVGPYPYPNGVSPLNSPTGWKLNIRQGDKIRFNDSGAYYTIAGPIRGLTPAQNSERFICYAEGETSGGATPSDVKWLPEYLDLTNGVDDNGNGWVDEACDGIDNDGDGIIDPGFNGVDDNKDGVIDNAIELSIGPKDPAAGDYTPVVDRYSEYEHEVFLGVQAGSPPTNASYTISRRPVVSPNSAETTLPGGVVIDLTTWNAGASRTSDTAITPTLPERSRLPVDPFSGVVDILLDQTGQVVHPGAGSGNAALNGSSPLSSLPFYHFWLTDREGVVEPLAGSFFSPALGSAVPKPNAGYGATATSTNYLLPMPQGTADYPGPNYLKGERRLVTLFAKTGQITSSSIENNSSSDQKFNVHNTSQPYYEAQSGVKEQQ